MIEISIITAVINNVVMLMIGAIIGIVAICIIRAAKDEPEKDDWNVLICMVSCKDRVSPTQLMQRRLALIGKKEYLKLYEKKNGAYNADGEPIDDNVKGA